jgi:L-lactate utilization protein LutC
MTVSEPKRVGQTGRDAILGRIRAAQPPHTAGHNVKLSDMVAPATNVLERFRQECQGNMTELIETNTATDSVEALQRVLVSLPPGKLYVQDEAQLHGLLGKMSHDRPTIWSSEQTVPEDTQATLTLAEALVAQTGSILTSSACGGRGASAVPPCHIVYATTAQLLPDIEAALRYAQKSGITERNSYVGLISGSSRTADIEKILVLGAHGPRRLVVVIEQV